MNTRTEIISLVRNNPVKSISFFRIEDYKRYRELKQSSIIASQQICKDLAVNYTRTLPGVRSELQRQKDTARCQNGTRDSRTLSGVMGPELQR